MLSEWLLYVHVLSAIVYVGGAVAVTLQAFGAARAPAPFLTFSELAGRAIGAAAILTLLSGIALVLESDVWGFSTFFVWFGIAAIVAAGAVEGVYQRKRLREAEEAAEQGDDAAAAVGIRQMATVNAAVLAVFFVVVWAMVFRAGA
jgi:hypothetical protein